MTKRKNFSNRRASALYGAVYDFGMEMRIEFLRCRPSTLTVNARDTWLAEQFDRLAHEVVEEYERSYARGRKTEGDTDGGTDSEAPAA